MRKYLFFVLVLLVFSAQGQKTTFRNGQLDVVLTPFRMPLPNPSSVSYIDLDKDGDPDVLKAILPNGIHVQWIDDDDDMKKGDFEGDMDNDCVMLDLNQDGSFSGPKDLMVDWSDEDQDGKADWQCIVDNAEADYTGKWTSHYIWFWDADQDGIFGYVDWNHFKFEGWDHDGRANFYTDYNGQSMMLKVHITTSNIKDLRYNWENPFLYFDQDQDGLTEMAMRMVDEPIAITDEKNPKMAWDFSHQISMVQMTFDLDNDNAPGNELDFDMSLKFAGAGFDYSDQIHDFDHLQGLPEANIYFEDPRWRTTTQLIYPDHQTAYDLTFNRGKWNQCWFVFDEDDDCQRWERVEFYDPKDPFKIGAKNGGLDNNPQADPTGDRGEWDTDFSGKGQLYISPLDGRLHLYGAEYGYWRIDQNSTYFQGWQGWRGPNLQPEDFDKAEPTVFGTMKYEDTDNNGFFDKIQMDMDGDFIYEQEVALSALGISDEMPVFNIANWSYKDFQATYQSMAENIWKNAQNGLKVARKYGLNTGWYAQLSNAKSAREKYHYGYWLSLYLYRDLSQLAEMQQNNLLKIKIQKAYFSSDWKMCLK